MSSWCPLTSPRLIEQIPMTPAWQNFQATRSRWLLPMPQERAQTWSQHPRNSSALSWNDKIPCSGAVTGKNYHFKCVEMLFPLKIEFWEVTRLILGSMLVLLPCWGVLVLACGKEGAWLLDRGACALCLKCFWFSPPTEEERLVLSHSVKNNDSGFPFRSYCLALIFLTAFSSLLPRGRRAQHRLWCPIFSDLNPCFTTHELCRWIIKPSW